MTYVENIAKSITENTKMVWIETPTNPTMKLIDIDLAIKAVKAVDPKIIVVVDNTFASPYLQSPMLLGADVAYNSCSKYIGGHSDLIGGAIVYNDELLHKKLTLAANSIGANPSPFDCYLMLRGVKTLEQRVIESTKNAYHIAHYMENN
jgi:cystathionine gamma-lyase